MEPVHIISWAAFGAVFFTAWAILHFRSTTVTASTERLKVLLKSPHERNRSQKEDAWNKAMSDSVSAIAKTLEPRDQQQKNQVKLRLSNAGFNSPGCVELYFASKMAALAAGTLIGGALGVNYL